MRPLDLSQNISFTREIILHILLISAALATNRLASVPFMQLQHVHGEKKILPTIIAASFTPDKT